MAVLIKSAHHNYAIGGKHIPYAPALQAGYEMKLWAL